MTRWEVRGDDGSLTKLPPRKPIRVKWWWYVLTVAALCVVLAFIFAACGGDTGFTEEDYDWFKATSPSGVELECLGYGEGLWCREVGEP